MRLLILVLVLLIGDSGPSTEVLVEPSSESVLLLGDSILLLVSTVSGLTIYEVSTTSREKIKIILVVSLR